MSDGNLCNNQILVAVSHDAFRASVPAEDQSRGCQTGYRDDLPGDSERRVSAFD
jgi:hypothetical protein